MVSDRVRYGHSPGGMLALSEHRATHLGPADLDHNQAVI